MMTALPNKRHSGRRKAAEHLEKRSGEKNVDSGLQVQLEEDGYGSTGYSWTSGLWADPCSTGSDKAYGKRLCFFSLK